MPWLGEGRVEQATDTVLRGTRENPMRLILSLIIIIYLVGIGVVLSPTIQGKWNTGTASELVASVWEDLPRAMAWPATMYHSLRDEQHGQPVRNS